MIEVTLHELERLDGVLLEGIRRGVLWGREHPAGDRPGLEAIKELRNPYAHIVLFQRVWGLGFKCGLAAERGELTDA